jgi:Ca-activated chloride channel family protein
MTFASPGSFFLLLALPLLWILFFLDYRKRRSVLKALFSQAAQREVLKNPSLRRSIIRLGLLTFFLAAGVTALARPRWGEKIEMLPQRNLNLYCLLDCSLSMLAEDVRPSRFNAAKKLIGAIADRLASDQLALVNVAASPYLQCPLTFDREAFKIMLEISEPSPTAEQGTDFGKLFAFCLKIARTESEGINVLLLVSDGEDHPAQWSDSLKELKKARLPVFTVGIGKAAAATIPILGDAAGRQAVKVDRNGNTVFSALQSATLRAISDGSGGKYFAYEKDEDYAGIQVALRAIVSGELNRKYRKIPQERFYYPLFLAVFLLAAFVAVGEVAK